MVLQNQIDILEFLIGGNNINNNILTPEGEVNSFPVLSRNMMEPESTVEVDFLDDSAMSMSHGETVATVEEGTIFIVMFAKCGNGGGGGGGGAKDYDDGDGGGVGSGRMMVVG